MAELPYLNAPSYITTVLDKIISAPTPQKFTQSFLHTKLNVTSSSARPIIPFLKRMGFITADGSPTNRYRQFRNSATRGRAAAEGVKSAFHGLYESNEYAHDLSPSDLEGLVVQVTDLDTGNQIVRAVIGSFEALKRYADFDGTLEANEIEAEVNNDRAVPTPYEPHQRLDTKFNLGYTINLNLPETTDAEVFDAIFKSLRDNLLRS